MIDLDIKAADLERVALDIGATEAQVKKALNTTLNKMAAWVKTRTTKSLADDLQIKQKVVRRRIKAMKRKGGGMAGVWYGLNDIAMIYLGAKQTAGGVRASGGRFEKGAFIPRGVHQVFKRVGAKRMMTKGRYKGKLRQPIEVVESAIEDKSIKTLNDTINAAAFEAQFFKVFEHELQWRMQTR